MRGFGRFFNQVPINLDDSDERSSAADRNRFRSSILSLLSNRAKMRTYYIRSNVDFRTAAIIDMFTQFSAALFHDLEISLPASFDDLLIG